MSGEIGLLLKGEQKGDCESLQQKEMENIATSYVLQEDAEVASPDQQPAE